MIFKINDEEKKLIKDFKKSHIPSIFKTDVTDRILFLETVDFDICALLLKGKAISEEDFAEFMYEYNRYLENSNDINEFDEYTLAYHNNCLQIVGILKKYYKEN